MEKKVAIVANKLYVEDVLAAEEVRCTLPAIGFQTADVQAMGSLTLPLIGLLEHMEMSITQIGLDKNTAVINKLEKQTFELRWAQEKATSDGSIVVEGCKAFLRTIPTAIPSVGIETGSATELEGTYSVSRYQLFVDGEEVLLVDRLANILKINGKDYYDEVKSLL